MQRYAEPELDGDEWTPAEFPAYDDLVTTVVQLRDAITPTVASATRKNCWFICWFLLEIYLRRQLRKSRRQNEVRRQPRPVDDERLIVGLNGARIQPRPCFSQRLT